MFVAILDEIGLTLFQAAPPPRPPLPSPNPPKPVTRRPLQSESVVDESKLFYQLNAIFIYCHTQRMYIHIWVQSLKSDDNLLDPCFVMTLCTAQQAPTASSPTLHLGRRPPVPPRLLKAPRPPPGSVQWRAPYPGYATVPIYPPLYPPSYPIKVSQR